MSPQQQYRSPDGVRSADPSSPPSDEEGQFFPTHLTSHMPSNASPRDRDRDRKEGLASTIGKTRFLILMMMVIPLVLGSWVILNSRLYDVSFVFDRDGRVKIKRKAVSKVKLVPSPTSLPIPAVQKKQMTVEKRNPGPGRQVKVKSSSQQGIRVSGGGTQRLPPRNKADTAATAPVMQYHTQRGKRYATSTPKQLTKKPTPSGIPMQQKTKPPATSMSTKRYTSPKSFGIKASHRGFYDSIVLRRRRGSGSPTLAPTTDAASSAAAQQPTYSRGEGLFRSIRLRRRPAAEKRVYRDNLKKSEPAPRKMKADMKPLRKTQMTKSLPSEVADAKKKQTVQPKSIKSQIAAKKSTSSEPRRGGLLGLFSGIRLKRAISRKEPEPEPEIPILEIRLRLRKRKKSKAPRGVMMRQPSIKKKRQEAAKIAKELAIEEKKLAKVEATKTEKKRRQAAKIESFNKMRDKLDAAKIESTQRKEAKKDAALLKSKMRVEANFDRAMQKQKAADSKVAHTMQKQKAAATKKEQKKKSDSLMVSFWRSMRPRRRSSAKKARAVGEKTFSKPTQNPIVVEEPKQGFFSSIRSKRRQKKTTGVSPPAEMVKKTVASKAKEVAAKKHPPTRKVSTPKSPPKQRPTVPTLVKKQVQTAAVTKTAPTTSLQRRAPSPPRRSFLGYVTSMFSSRKKRTRKITVPLVEKNAPEKVLPELVKHFTSFLPEGDGIGRPRPRSLKEMIQAPDRGSSTIVATSSAPQPVRRYTTIRIREKQKAPTKRPPAIRIRRVKRNR